MGANRKAGKGSSGDVVSLELLISFKILYFEGLSLESFVAVLIFDTIIA